MPLSKLAKLRVNAWRTKVSLLRNGPHKYGVESCIPAPAWVQGPPWSKSCLIAGATSRLTRTATSRYFPWSRSS